MDKYIDNGNHSQSGSHHVKHKHKSHKSKHKKKLFSSKMLTPVLITWLIILTFVVAVICYWCISTGNIIHEMQAFIKNEDLSYTETDSSSGKVDNIPDYVKEEATRVADEVSSLQSEDTVTFLAVSDMHLNLKDSDSIASLTHAGQAMKLIRDQVDIDFAAGFGDFTWGDNTTTIEQGLDEIKTANEFINPAFEGIPNFRAIGNHDTLYVSYGQNNDYLDSNELFDLFGAYNQDAVFQEGKQKSGYFYQDLEKFKLRIICLNTNETFFTDDEETELGMTVSSVQLQWLAGVLDLSEKADSKEWGIILLSHHPLQNVGHTKVVTLLDAYVSGQNGNIDDVSYNFEGKNQAKIVASFHGHLHNFRMDTIGNSRIPSITIPNASYNRNNTYGTGEVYSEGTKNTLGEKVTYNKTPNSNQDTAFCVITIDLKYKRIYATHYGAGYSREIGY